MSTTLDKRVAALEEKLMQTQQQTYPHIFVTIDGRLVDLFHTPGLAAKLGWA